MKFYKRIRWGPGMLTLPNKDGNILEHREIAAQKIGRRLRPSESVHHLDENKFNNDPANLIVFSTKADHARAHAGGEYIANEDGTFHCVGSSGSRGVEWCMCQCRRQTKHPQAATCMQCYSERRSSRIPPMEELAELLWEMPTSAIARKYGVSDVAVSKWCRKYGLPKPPRGYWTQRPRLRQ